MFVFVCLTFDSGFFP